VLPFFSKYLEEDLVRVEIVEKAMVVCEAATGNSDSVSRIDDFVGMTFIVNFSTGRTCEWWDAVLQQNANFCAICNVLEGTTLNCFNELYCMRVPVGEITAPTQRPPMLLSSDKMHRNWPRTPILVLLLS
jgi:hypothetical protein